MDGSSIEALLTVDPCVMDDETRLETLRALEALRARVDARTQRLLAAIDTDPPTAAGVSTVEMLNKHWVREEVACLLHLAPATAGVRLAEARFLVVHLASTLDLLEAGRLSLGHVRSLVDATVLLDDQARARVEAHVLQRAPGQTIGEFRQATKRAVARFDARGEERKHAAELEQRRVVVTPGAHGMAELYAYLPADGAQAVWDRIQADADHLKTCGDPHSADKRRADALVALAASAVGGTPIGVRVELAMSEATLRGAGDEPAELTGYGPIPAGLARNWVRRSVLDQRGIPVPDQAVTITPTVHRPGMRLSAYLRRRDRTCRFPGCRRNAARCEIDHVSPFNGDNTVPENLHCLCPRHHHLKHEAGWTVDRRPDGTTAWQSPTGRKYEKPPDDRPR